MINSTHNLMRFVASLEYDDIPPQVVKRCEELCLDWIGSALAGKNQSPIPLFEAYAHRMGPTTGPSQILTNRVHTSPYFAAFVNGAASHVVEQDDLHNSSVLHPATVVFPALLSAAQDLKSNGQEFITAAVAGYEAGIRIGEFMGRSHYTIFHTTGTVGTLAAAVAVGKLMKFDEQRLVDLLGTAGTQASGLWEFLRDAADSKQLHTAKAAADGLLSAYLTADGLTGAQQILEGPQGMAAGMSTDSDPAHLEDLLGRRWAIAETSFKFHACCRHTHPAADALLKVMQEQNLAAEDILSVSAGVHQAALDVLGVVDVPTTIHQAKFSMGTVLGLIAVHGSAGLTEFQDKALQDPEVAAFRDKVAMTLNTFVDAAYPRKWLGRVRVTTVDGCQFEGIVDDPKGDPGNPLDRDELEAKFRRLVAFSGAATEREADSMVRWCWTLKDVANVGIFFNKGKQGANDANE